MGGMSGGTLGALFGFVLGSMIDSFISGNQLGYEPQTPEERDTHEQQGTRNGFLFSLMVLAADVIQADGRIMHSEMEYVRRFLRTNFSEEAEKEGEEILHKLFEQKKSLGQAEWERQMRAVCQQVAANMPEEHRLQLVAFLCEIAKADKTVAPEERQALENICIQMGLNAKTAEQLMGLGGTSLDDAYKLLGVSPDASDDEVKRAYKKMVMQHHPDRVAYLGEDIRKASEKKFKEINDAKERIYKARGIR